MTDSPELAARLAELEAENAQLRAASGVATAPAARPSRGRWRAGSVNSGLRRVWVNPDCGLKTRGYDETVASLRNLVTAADRVRGELQPIG